jgi:hypothetical protein
MPALWKIIKGNSYAINDLRKKASVFMLAVSWGMAVPFLRSVFAQRLIIEDDLW